MLSWSLWHLGAVTKEKQIKVENVSQRLNLTSAEFCKIPATTFVYISSCPALLKHLVALDAELLVPPIV